MNEIKPPDFEDNLKETQGFDWAIIKSLCIASVVTVVVGAIFYVLGTWGAQLEVWKNTSVNPDYISYLVSTRIILACIMGGACGVATFRSLYQDLS